MISAHFLSHATSLPCPHLSLKPVSLCPFINLPHGPVFSMRKPASWEPQLKAKINNHLKSYHFLFTDACIYISLSLSSLQGRRVLIPFLTGEGPRGAKKLIMVSKLHKWGVVAGLELSSVRSPWINVLHCLLSEACQIELVEISRCFWMLQTRSACLRALCLLGRNEASRNHRKGLGMSKWRCTHHLKPYWW